MRKKMIWKPLASLGALVLFGWGTSASAACNGGVTVTTTVQAIPYDPDSADTPPYNFTVTLTCSRFSSAAPTAYTINLGGSNNQGINGNVSSPRQMRNTVTGETLSYNIYVPGSSTVVWANGRGGSPVQGSFTGAEGANVVANAAGSIRLTARQPVSAGTYSDTIRIEVVY